GSILQDRVAREPVLAVRHGPGDDAELPRQRAALEEGEVPVDDRLDVDVERARRLLPPLEDVGPDVDLPEHENADFWPPTLERGPQQRAGVGLGGDVLQAVRGARPHVPDDELLAAARARDPLVRVQGPASKVGSVAVAVDSDHSPAVEPDPGTDQ